VFMEIFVCVSTDEFSDHLCLPNFPAIFTLKFIEIPGVKSLCPTREVIGC
jgi:hypothetical protein